METLYDKLGSILERYVSNPYKRYIRDSFGGVLAFCLLPITVPIVVIAIVGGMIIFSPVFLVLMWIDGARSLRKEWCER